MQTSLCDHTLMTGHPLTQDTKGRKRSEVNNMTILFLQSCHHNRRKGDRPAGPFFLFFLLLLRWLSCEKASAAFCSRATKTSMSSRAQLRICWGDRNTGFLTSETQHRAQVNGAVCSVRTAVITDHTTHHVLLNALGQVFVGLRVALFRGSSFCIKTFLAFFFCPVEQGGTSETSLTPCGRSSHPSLTCRSGALRGRRRENGFSVALHFLLIHPGDGGGNVKT